jgi:hypothetical protein
MFGKHGKEVDGSRQAGFGSPPDLFGDPKPGLGPSALASERKGKAETALGAIGGCGAFVPSVGRLGIADRFWTAGEDVSENRLAGRRPTFGRLACPPQRRSEVGLARRIPREQLVGAGTLFFSSGRRQP